uniref:Putative RNA-directed DNA polymerase from transposon X-element n=1 Tax=Lygus hesperus TaxID=30085 RepID=A0A0A9YTU1_LYGHE
MDGFRSGVQTDVIATDFAKAFDKLSHRHLLSLLESLGIHGSFLAWLRSYLVGRQLVVRVKGALSSSFLASSGIPQGSHLGPLCFLIMINSVVNQTIADGIRCLLFADDLKLFVHSNSPLDCESLQASIYRLEDWCTANHLFLNASKCSVVTFHRLSKPIVYNYTLCGSPLRRSDGLVDLGVFCDERLSFSSHIEALASRAMRTLGFLKRNTREFSSVDAILTIYKALVLPTLDYASTIWSPSYGIHKYRLERVQKKFLRYIAYKMGIAYENVDFESLQRRCGLTTLERRRCLNDLVLLYKIVNDVMHCPPLLSRIDFLVPRVASRSPLLFSVPFAATNYDRNRPLARLPRSANLFLTFYPQFDFFFSPLSSLKSLFSNSHVSFQ